MLTLVSQEALDAAGGMSWKLVYQCNEESVFDKKDEDVPQEMMSALPAFCLFYSQLCCCFCSLTKSCLILCDPRDCSTPGFPVLHYLPEFAQIQVHWVSDASEPSHSLWTPTLFAFNLSQHQGLCQWVRSSHRSSQLCAVLCLSLSCVWFFANPWTVACQAPLSMGFFRQEYWSGLPLSSLGKIFPTQVSHITGRFFTIWATREAQEYWSGYLSLLQGISLTQESNWGLLHCRRILYQLSHQGSHFYSGF